jgi:hypothetical protein
MVCGCSGRPHHFILRQWQLVILRDHGVVCMKKELAHSPNRGHTHEIWLGVQFVASRICFDSQVGALDGSQACAPTGRLIHPFNVLPTFYAKSCVHSECHEPSFAPCARAVELAKSAVTQIAALLASFGTLPVHRRI